MVKKTPVSELRPELTNTTVVRVLNALHYAGIEYVEELEVMDLDQLYLSAKGFGKKSLRALRRAIASYRSKNSTDNRTIRIHGIHGMGEFDGEYVLKSLAERDGVTDICIEPIPKDPELLAKTVLELEGVAETLKELEEAMILVDNGHIRRRVIGAAISLNGCAKQWRKDLDRWSRDRNKMMDSITGIG